MKKIILYMFAVTAICLCTNCNRPERDLDNPASITIDYSQTIEQVMDSNKGLWSFDSSIITENSHWPAEKTGKKEILSAQLLRFPDDIRTKDAMTAIDRAGYRPGTLAELIALGIQYPELREKAVAAIGSDANVSYVPCWKYDGQQCVLKMIPFDVSWESDGIMEWDESGWRFLAIPKS